MRCASRALAAFALAAALACGGHSSSGTTPPLTIPAPADNVMTLSVNGALCSRSYLNKPCVEVTVCAPGTTTCQRISDVLLDTGSFGLRLFSQALGTLSLPTVQSGSGTLATCVQYADGSADWGPVRKADVVLGSEPPVQVAIQEVDATFASVPSGCADPQKGPEKGPADAGFNGVLGVGVFTEDCGPGCATANDNGIYYACDAGGTCAGTSVAVADQIQNPVASLPGDNNGVIVVLPAAPPGGVASVDGALVLGVGTRPNNAVSGLGVYALDGHGDLSTTFSGQTIGGFLDTGSNGLFFPAPSNGSLPSCASPDQSFFCPPVTPPATVSLSASNASAGGTGGPTVGFQIGNFDKLLQTPNAVFPDIGGDALPNEGFDWGLPFHLGRRVVVGFDGRQSPLGTGPYAAY